MRKVTKKIVNVMFIDNNKTDIIKIREIIKNHFKNINLLCKHFPFVSLTKQEQIDKITNYIDDNWDFIDCILIDMILGDEYNEDICVKILDNIQNNHKSSINKKKIAVITGYNENADKLLQSSIWEKGYFDYITKPDFEDITSKWKISYCGNKNCKEHKKAKKYYCENNRCLNAYLEDL